MQQRFHPGRQRPVQPQKRLAQILPCHAGRAIRPEQFSQHLAAVALWRFDHEVSQQRLNLGGREASNRFAVKGKLKLTEQFEHDLWVHGGIIPYAPRWQN